MAGAVTLLLCCIDLRLILPLSACYEAAIQEDPVPDYYFAAAQETR
jgi:hypothetical protein